MSWAWWPTAIISVLSEGRGKKITTSSRPTWTTKWVPRWPGLQSETLPQKKSTKTDLQSNLLITWVKNKLKVGVWYTPSHCSLAQCEFLQLLCARTTVYRWVRGHLLGAGSLILPHRLGLKLQTRGSAASTSSNELSCWPKSILLHPFNQESSP